MIQTSVHTWHSVYRAADEMASAAQTVDLVCMLANFCRPTVFVEAGTYKGHLTLAIANVLQIIEHGTIWTADTTDNFTPALQEMSELEQRIVDRVVFHHGDFLDMLKDI